MSDRRVREHPVLGSLEAVEEVTFRWRGQAVRARKGEPIAAALWAAGVMTLGESPRSGAPRGLYCAIGHCMSCRVVVDGVRDVRACLRPVEGGEEVTPC